VGVGGKGGGGVLAGGDGGAAAAAAAAAGASFHKCRRRCHTHADSPGLNSVTLSPTASTTPAASQPSTCVETVLGACASCEIGPLTLPRVKTRVGASGGCKRVACDWVVGVATCDAGMRRRGAVGTASAPFVERTNRCSCCYSAVQPCPRRLRLRGGRAPGKCGRHARHNRRRHVSPRTRSPWAGRTSCRAHQTSPRGPSSRPG
jgi:hypothetical protein